ncbi:unnamed protein product [Laminaria digitata]
MKDDEIRELCGTLRTIANSHSTRLRCMHWQRCICGPGLCRLCPIGIANSKTRDASERAAISTCRAESHAQREDDTGSISGMTVCRRQTTHGYRYSTRIVVPHDVPYRAMSHDGVLMLSVLNRLTQS